MKILKILSAILIIGGGQSALASLSIDPSFPETEATLRTRILLNWDAPFYAKESYKTSHVVVHNRTACLVEMGGIILPPKKSFNFEIRHLQENEPQLTLKGGQLLFKTPNALEASFTYTLTCTPTQPLTVFLREARMPKGENLLALGRHVVGGTPAPLENRLPLESRVVKHASLPTRGAALKSLILVEERRN